ncbi:regulatory GntR family protein [Mycoplasmopsis mustelae]|uniref:Regulatory GntR family protein n=1 Tax=Mycoplasmopsis mustelae TaxID=171289 RepID=A0A4R7UEC9_9BACT|nr:winged helix-turn-helix domain-containing protein [Mycoplasmopsis mustelae]TDV24213.1 regulatory GntR family protein [Mycoplasmopsis mustelae]
MNNVRTNRKYVKDFQETQQNKRNVIQTKTNNLIEYLIDLIASKKIPVNMIMPSEHQLMSRFNCSRSVVVSAYQKLFSIGAIYSISKRGHFVAENFHNLIKPISYLLNVDRILGQETKNNLPTWFKEKNIIFLAKHRSFKLSYEKKGEIIAEADIYVSTKNIDEFEPIDLRRPLVNILTERQSLKNMVYELKYEKVNKFNLNYMVVVSFWGYDDNSICIAGKYYIKPEHFKFYHQEFSLYI